MNKIILDGVAYDLDVAKALDNGSLKRRVKPITDIKSGDIFLMDGHPMVATFSSGTWQFYYVTTCGGELYYFFPSPISTQDMLSYLNNKKAKLTGNIADVAKSHLVKTEIE